LFDDDDDDDYYYYGSLAFFFGFGRFPVSSYCKRPVGFLGQGISPSQVRYLHTGQHKEGVTYTEVHASSGTATHDSSV
jgi:hypothetical protein